jgi:predicted DNA-binding helix-hairpin-helix protein
MELLDKLAILADAAKYDASCASSGSEKRDSAGQKSGIGSTEGMGICHAYAPDGRCISLLKILLTNACVYDCLYCINRRSSNVKRARFSVAEVVTLTLGFYRRNCIEGLFLSSGIIRSPDYTMEQVVAVARILREEHGFRGYIHLKTIPDADPALLVDEARAEKGSPRFAPAGQSTQVIVGADASPDRQILAMSRTLYGSYGLRRVYYSAFSPIPDASTALPPKAAPLVREHRLYQADWLMRFYGFDATEMATDAAGNLDLEIDPKTAWALQHREFFPVDANRAPREALLRVPGLGVKSVGRILSARRHRRLRVDDLARIGVPIRRAAPFLVALDHTPGATLDGAHLAARVKPAVQADLFA